MLFKGQLSAHFSIKSYLENGEVVLRPTCDDLYKFVQRALDRMFDRLKWLKEWENGSCIVKKECQQFFYRSLLEDADIKERRILALKNLQVLNNALMASASSWLKYSVLWEDDKDASITQFSSNAPSLSDYEFKFDYYSNMMNVIEKEKRIVNLFCVNIEVEKLINQLKNHCIEWKDKLGIQLALHTKQTIDDVAETIQKLKSTLNIKIANYKDLIDVLMCINDIEQIEIDVLIKFYKIKEHYHELSIRNFKMCIEDLDRFNRLQIEWENIYDTSLLKKFMLEPTKIIVADTMKTRIVKFGEECRAFVSRYKEDKLKLEYLNFNSCIELILDYAQQYSRLYEKKEELLKIHNCFEIMLPIKFDDFTNMKTELEDVKSKFKILDEID